MALKLTRRGNPLATKSQLASRIIALTKVSQALGNALQIESPVRAGLKSSQFSSFKSSATSIVSTVNSAIAHLRGRLESGKHN